MTEEQLVETVALCIERSMFAPHEFPLSLELHAKYLTTARAVIEELKFARASLTTPGDLQFRYAVRDALGMNDKCGLTGLERDVAEVRRLALRLRAALIDMLDAWESKSGMGTMYDMQRAAPNARSALAEAQFPRLWDAPT